MARIEAKGTMDEFEVQGLERNESLWLRVENFDLLIKRTDEGIVVDVFAFKENGDYGEALSSTYAYDGETTSDEEE